MLEQMVILSIFCLYDTLRKRTNFDLEKMLKNRRNDFITISPFGGNYKACFHFPNSCYWILLQLLYRGNN